MNLIVAVDENWGIGKDNDLLISIPDDMKFFKEKTMNHPIIMGRKTLDSFPNGPLKNRLNIVLSKTLHIYENNVVCFKSIEDILTYISKNKLEDVFVIGGGSIYKQLLPYCNIAYVTKIYSNFDADTFFPNLDEMKDWKILNTSEMKSFNGVQYQFITCSK